MMAQSLLSNTPLTLASNEELVFAIPIVAIVGGMLIALVSVVSNAVKSALARRQYEESRREIAAYVAEGTIKPDDAERLLKADMPAGSCGTWNWKSPRA